MGEKREEMSSVGVYDYIWHRHQEEVLNVRRLGCNREDDTVLNLHTHGKELRRNSCLQFSAALGIPNPIEPKMSSEFAVSSLERRRHTLVR